MCATDPFQREADETDWQFPLELVGAVDDREDPDQYTVFPRANVDITTRWLSVDIGHVVDLESMV